MHKYVFMHIYVCEYRFGETFRVDDGTRGTEATFLVVIVLVWRQKKKTNTNKQTNIHY